MNTDLKATILKYDRAVPRYTSYPTAPHFKEGFSRDTYAGWLEALPENTQLSLYIHIPFCDVICWYCGCHTKATKRYEPVNDYVDMLIREIDMMAVHIPSHCIVKHLHFGGGSPTILQPAEFKRVMDALYRHFTFADDAERAIEGDPRGMDDDKLKAYADTGINRVSLGVQDFDPKVMETINRVQPYEVVFDCVERIRKHGIDKLNMDFIYGLPFQTLDTTVKTMHQALTMTPDRLALFGYAHVPWMKKHMRLIKDETLPDKSLRYDLFNTAAEILRGAGYETIGIDHFAKSDDPMAIQTRDGNLRRNFQGYTTDAANALVGFGVSSISELPQGYVQNQPHNILYRELIGNDRIPVYRGIEKSAEDKLRKDVIDALMCRFTVDVGAVCVAHGFAASALDDCFDELQEFERDGLARVEERVVTIHPDALQIVRIIASAFDGYFKTGIARHSKAV